MNFKEPNSQRLFGHELCDVLAGVADGASPCEMISERFKTVARAMHRVLLPPAAADVDSLAEDFRLVKSESGRTKMCAYLFPYGSSLTQDTLDRIQGALDIDNVKSELAQHMSELESILRLATEFITMQGVDPDGAEALQCDSKILRPLTDRSEQMRALIAKATEKVLDAVGAKIMDVVGSLVEASTILQEHFESVASAFIRSLPDEPADGDGSEVLSKCAEADRVLGPFVSFLTKLKLATALAVEKRFGSFSATSWHDRVIYTSVSIRAAKNFYDLSVGNASNELLVEKLHLFLGMYKTHHEEISTWSRLDENSERPDVKKMISWFDRCTAVAKTKSEDVWRECSDAC